MIDLRSKFAGAWARLKVALLVLKGVVPARLNPGDALHALQAELASARAETGRLAAELAEARRHPDVRREELLEAKAEIEKLGSELLVAQAEASQSARALARQTGRFYATTRINEALHVFMPETVLQAAREEDFKVVDVGAQMLESADHIYTQLVVALSGQIIGFEPLGDERQKRVEKETAVTMLPHAIGSGQSAVLRVTKFSPASSLLVPDGGKLADFLALPEMLEVIEETPLETRRLDDIPEADGCRLLKIDVQGGELDVLKGAVNSLQSVLAVFVEVEFLDIYQSQPLFPSVHALLEQHGFELLDLLEPGYGSYRAANNGRLQSRLLWADGLYVRKLGLGRVLTIPQLLQLACAGHFLAKKFDYAAHVLAFCDREHGTAFARDYSGKLKEAEQRLEAQGGSLPDTKPGFR